MWLIEGSVISIWLKYGRYLTIIGLEHVPENILKRIIVSNSVANFSHSNKGRHKIQ